jgi:general secretion pathway protein D
LSDDRETIVLGGLIRDDVREVVSKVPLLGDIPLLGWLFRSKSTNQVKSNLMVFLRATIVSDAGIAKNLTQDKFNGIWEFTVSEELAADDSNIKMERLFDGLPLKK